MEAFQDWIQHTLHPRMLKDVLYDRHVEERMGRMVELEQLCYRVHGLSLFIQCDMESHRVIYEVRSEGFLFSLPFRSA